MDRLHLRRGVLAIGAALTISATAMLENPSELAMANNYSAINFQTTPTPPNGIISADWPLFRMQSNQRAALNGADRFIYPQIGIKNLHIFTSPPNLNAIGMVVSWDKGIAQTDKDKRLWFEIIDPEPLNFYSTPQDQRSDIPSGVQQQMIDQMLYVVTGLEQGDEYFHSAQITVYPLRYVPNVLRIPAEMASRVNGTSTEPAILRAGFVFD